MARKRMIDPTIWEDENFGKLSPRAKVLFIGLFSNADDEGRIRANDSYLRSTVFMYDDIALNEIKKHLQEITNIMKHVHIYTVDNNIYCHLNNWDEFQKQKTDRISPSMLPECPKCNVSINDVLDGVTDSEDVTANLPVRIRITKRDKGCRYCGIEFPNKTAHFVLEHIIPKKLGGETNDDNLVLACQKCNSKKGQRTPEEAGMELLPIPTMETKWKQNGNNLEHEVKLSKVKLSKDKLRESMHTSLKNIKEIDLQEIADKYQVPISFVLSKLDDMKNWMEAKGKTYKNYKAALSNWVKKDALQIKQEHHGKSKVYDATNV